MWAGTIGEHGSLPSVEVGNDRRVGNNPGSPYLAHWVFSGRSAGVSNPPFDSMNLADHVGDDPEAVARNRELLLEALAGQSTVELDGLVLMQAVHGNKVRRVGEFFGQQVVGRVSSQPDCDGLVTAQRNTAVAALAADCVPLVLADVSHGVVGAVHCGWRGVVSGVVDSALEQMRRLGAGPRTTTAVIGPAICGECYVVDSQRAAQVAATPGVDRAVSRDSQGRWHVDVRHAVIAQLRTQNVSYETVGGCTFTDDQLFSYRQNPTTGRQGAAIVLSGAA